MSEFTVQNYSNFATC